jgi:hypothetical protein
VPMGCDRATCERAGRWAVDGTVGGLSGCIHGLAIGKSGERAGGRAHGDAIGLPANGRAVGQQDGIMGGLSGCIHWRAAVRVACGSRVLRTMPWVCSVFRRQLLI